MMLIWNPQPIAKADGDGYNPYRDEDGKFASGPGGKGKGKSKPVPKSHVGAEAWKHLSADEKSAVDEYTEMSADINQVAAHGWGDKEVPDTYTGIRRKMIISTQSVIHKLDAVMSKSELDPGDYWRGISDEMLEIMQSTGALSEGKTFSYNSFMSTSKSRDTAERFSSLDEEGGAIFKITMPAGVHGLNIDDAAAEEMDKWFDAGADEEGVVARGTKFKTVKAGTTTIRVGRIGNRTREVAYYELEAVVS